MEEELPMGRIFIAAGRNVGTRGTVSPISVIEGTTEAAEMIMLRDLLVAELRSRDRTHDFEVLAVPDELDATQTTQWINSRAQRGDVAIEVRAQIATSSDIHGASIYYIAHNEERRGHAELMLLALVRRVPRLSSRGVRPDSETSLGQLVFCRQVAIPSLSIQVGCLTHRDDRTLLQTRRRDFALGLADGVSSWSRLTAANTLMPIAETPEHPTIPVQLNGGVSEEAGIIVNGNAYIPVDLMDCLSIPLSTVDTHRIQYRNVVYAKAVDLRQHNVSVAWDNDARTVLLQSVLEICPGDLDHIMGRGKVSDVQLIMFLKANNEKALETFPELPKYYREEALIEGVNYDIAFCQMCLETGYLRFGGDVKPEQNNFAGLGAIGGGVEGAHFQSPRLGVRAHIQHLKAYASREPLVQELVDPRFRFVSRGIAPLVDQLSGRWAADLDYGTKILAILKRLYEAVGLM